MKNKKKKSKQTKTPAPVQDTPHEPLIKYEYPGTLKLTNLIKANVKQDELESQQAAQCDQDPSVYKRLYHFAAPFRCAVCNSPALFFTTRNHTLVDYRQIIMQAYSGEEAYELIGGFKVLRLKCLHCNREWYIDWTGAWPTQLLDEARIQQFGLAVL